MLEKVVLHKVRNISAPTCVLKSNVIDKYIVRKLKTLLARINIC